MVKRVRFKHSGRDFTRYGEIYADKVEETLQEFKKRAESLIFFFNTAHVLYGAKLFDREGNLTQVNFYEDLILDDDEFEKRTCATDGIIYSVHRRA